MRIWAATPDQTAASQASAARRGAIYGGLFRALRLNLFVLGISHVVRRRIEQCSRFGHDVDNLGQALLWCHRGKGIGDFDLLTLFPLIPATVQQPELGGIGIGSVVLRVGLAAALAPPSRVDPAVVGW